jgi:hypothetical protein
MKTKKLTVVCCNCQKVRNDYGNWVRVNTNHLNPEHVSHGICPKCMAEIYPELMNLEWARNYAKKTTSLG